VTYYGTFWYSLVTRLGQPLLLLQWLADYYSTVFYAIISMSFLCSINIIITATNERTPCCLRISQQSFTHDCCQYSCCSIVSRLCRWYCCSLSLSLSFVVIVVIVQCHCWCCLAFRCPPIWMWRACTLSSFFVVVVCPYMKCYSWFLMFVLQVHQGSTLALVPLCRCCWLLMALAPSVGAVGCPWPPCCRLVVALVLLVVGAVSCLMPCSVVWWWLLVLLAFGGLGSVLLLIRWCCRLPWCRL